MKNRVKILVALLVAIVVFSGIGIYFYQALIVNPFLSIFIKNKSILSFSKLFNTINTIYGHR